MNSQSDKTILSKDQTSHVTNSSTNQGAQGIFNAPVNFHQSMLRSGRSDEALLRDYLCRLHQACNTLVFGDPLSGKPGQPMELAQVFTMLNVTTPYYFVDWQSDDDDEDENDDQEVHYIVDDTYDPATTVLDALADEQMCVLLGEPGGGKSTVLAFLTLAFAEAYSLFPDPQNNGGLCRLGPKWQFSGDVADEPVLEVIPVRVRLKDVAQKIWDGVPELQHSDLSVDERNSLIAYLENHLSVAGIILLDGLDEVPLERLPALHPIISDVLSRFSKSRIILSCRTYDYNDEPDRRINGMSTITLQPFTKRLQREFVDRWYAELVRTGRRNQSEANTKKDNLKFALERREDLSELAGSPLLMALIALVHTEEGELPLARALLYQRCIKLLLWRWRPMEDEGVVLDESRLLTLTAELGYLAHCQEKERGKLFRGLSRSDIRETAIMFFERGVQGDSGKRRAAEQGLAAAHRLINSNGLLLTTGIDVYGFAHRTFQEFLAGQYLGVGSRRKTALEHAADSHWRVALHLMAGYSAREGNLDYVLSLINTLERRSFTEVGLAAEMLIEIGQEPLRDKGYDDELERGGLWFRVADRLKSVAFNPDICPDAVIRNRAAESLEQLMPHQRLELDFEQLEYWSSRIEPGPFLMGNDNGAYESEGPTFDWIIKEPFALAKFPVTNRQYLQFLGSITKHRDSVEIERYLPSTWENNSYPEGKDNHPVCGVSWKGAYAFSSWVDEILHKKNIIRKEDRIRLPTEMEWERAAAYPVEIDRSDVSVPREHPWEASLILQQSNEYYQKHINSRESSIGSTSSVGIFPNSAADCQAQDLVGNVMEWCGNSFFAYPLPHDLMSSDEGNSAYPLRGGSWQNSYHYIARCTARLDRIGGSKDELIGFRLVYIFGST